MTARLLSARAPLHTEKRPGIVRIGYAPKDMEPLGAKPPHTVRIVGIDCGLARVSIAYFELGPKTIGKWYAAEIIQKAGAFRGVRTITTPPDMPLHERLRSLGEYLTAEFRATRPDHYFVEMPQDAGIYARNQEDAQAFGGFRQNMTAKLYLALGVIMAVSAEQARVIGGTIETPKPTRAFGKSKAERLKMLDVIMRRLSRTVELTNPNDLDACGVALGARWDF